MKKLTAGIFTALLGLVTVNAANAAIPSTAYVEEQLNNVRDAYEFADKTTLNSAKDYTDQQVGTLSELTTSAQGNTVAAINEVNAAYQTADTNLLNQTIGTDAMGEIKTGENASVNPTTLTQAVNALNAKIDYKTSGIATDAALSDLTTQVNTNKTDISGLKTRMDTAEGEIDTLQSEMDAVEAKAAANESAITVLKGSETTEGSVAKSVADAKAFVLQEASDMAGMAKADANKYTDDEISALTTTVNGKASQADLDTAESAIADNAAAILLKASQADLTATNAEVAKKADTTTMTTELAKKVDIAQGEGAANHVVITDTSGNVTTSATITQGQVSGLTTALDGKMPLTTTDDVNIGEDGTYVLTATTTGGATTYKWERIERYVAE